MKTTPRKARIYLLAAALMLVLPGLASRYEGHTGKFLVSTAVTRGSMFYHTVIYLDTHSLWGAHGIIINLPMAREDITNPFPELAWNVDLYDGGPVRWGEYNFLLIEDPSARNGILIAGVETLRQQRPDITNQLDHRANAKPYRLYSGFSGWGPLQLNIEILRGAWGITDYDPEIMLGTPVNETWTKAMERVLRNRPAASGGV